MALTGGWILPPQAIAAGAACYHAGSSSYKRTKNPRGVSCQTQTPGVIKSASAVACAHWAGESLVLMGGRESRTAAASTGGPGSLLQVIGPELQESRRAQKSRPQEAA